MVEKVNFCINIADVTVRLRGRYEQSADFCRDYFADDNATADIEVTISEERLIEEYNQGGGKDSMAFCERVLFLKELVNKLPSRGRMIFHGVAVKAFGKGYIFTAPPGTGKTTHALLLKKYFGEDITVINGDKPIIGMKNGEATVFPSPWCGKEHWQTKVEAPLEGIVILNRGSENKIEKIEPSDYFKELFFQIFKPEASEDIIKMIDIMNEISENVQFYRLECDMSREAAETSYKMMRG